MLSRLCDGLCAVSRFLMWLGFAGLILSVTLQVLARNILMVPMIWTSDMAQLLFTWLIFIGAAVGLRYGVHYTVDVLPSDRPLLDRVLFAIEMLTGAAVSMLLLIQGWKLAMARSTAEIQSLDISRFWMFLPLPICGAMMALFLIEKAVLAKKTEGRA